MRKLLMTTVIAGFALPAALEAQTATDLNCTSCISETELANQAVTGAKIANGTISTASASSRAPAASNGRCS